MDFIGALKEVFGAARATEEKLLETQKENNTAPMQAAASAQEFQNSVDAGKSAIQNEKLKILQARWAESGSPGA